jgi:hypothetical protein
MEVQDFALHMLLARLVFKEATPSVVDQRGALIAALQEEFASMEFTVESAAVEVFGEHRSTQYRIGTAQAVASVENFDDLEDVRRDLNRFFLLALTRLEGPRVSQIEVRSYDMAPTDSFDALRDALAASLVAPAPRLAEVVGKPLSDAGWIMDFLGGDPAVRMRFGPLRIEQVKTLLRDELDDRYPEQCLFLDVDYTETDEDLDPDQALAPSPTASRAIAG